VSSRRWLLACLAALCLALPAWGDDAGKSTAIEIDSSDDPTESVVWLAYAVGLANWASQSGALAQAPLGILEPSFEGEMTARRTLLVIWREMLQKAPKSSTYMDALMRIDAAGYLPEYVWTVHWRGSWKQPPAKLRIAEFYAWQRQELMGHVPRTGSRVRVVLTPPAAPASAASR
jgi:hypothetical protein